MPDTCVFCDVIAGKLPRTLIFEDTDTIVIKDIHPQAPVHLLVIPKAHIADFTALSSSEIATSMKVVGQMIHDHGIKNYRIVNNGGGAELIRHVHIHIIGSIDKHRNL
ncbi:MAG TPA: HIT domain-containing protein [Patescibacteria group bacterium]|nr:HIT domain-containing protein [Patescibacteria group bacterium]